MLWTIMPILKFIEQITTGPTLHSASTRKQDNIVGACDTISTLTVVLLIPAPTARSEVMNIRRQNKRQQYPRSLVPYLPMSN